MGRGSEIQLTLQVGENVNYLKRHNQAKIIIFISTQSVAIVSVSHLFQYNIMLSFYAHKVICQHVHRLELRIFCILANILTTQSVAIVSA